LLRASSRIASTARCLSPPSRIERPSSRTSSAPRIPKSIRSLSQQIVAGLQARCNRGSDSELFYLPIGTLYCADAPQQAEHWLDEAIADARTRGSVLGYEQASAAQAEVAYRQGQLTAAEAHARAAAATSHGDSLAVLINILVEQGRLDEAARLLEPYPLPADADHLLVQPIRAAAARLHLAQGRTADANSQLRACAQWLEAWPTRNPGFVPWRSLTALTPNKGDPEPARALANEEVALAKALGQPRAHGIALRALGLLQQGSDGTDLLGEAVTVLEQTPARLEHARALVDYGAALRRSEHRTDARKPLREGLDLAHQCRATMLAQRAHQELLATGARPRRPARSGRDALTPTEARVAQMAADGHTTPEIAQALFVTPKTIETHLTHTYQKLNIHTRRELTHALSQPQQ
jgi:DNA-binding CsgD family transcriptional regulator